ncbi:MAG: putative thioesterase [Moraxellaceae bacterium]|nr:MAG: putative thioesterase [Moraxellaceae bacterium]
MSTNNYRIPYVEAIPDISDDVWFQVPKPVAQPRLRLFCFNYAGGNASAYRDWYQQLPSDVEVCSIQLPGRGARFKESAYTNLNALLDALESAMSPYLGVSYAFFGHSMGAQVAYELARRLRDNGFAEPDYLFVSGRRAPQLPATRKPIHGLPEDQFLEEIRRLNGTPDEALNNPELMELVSPILRADCQVIETWDYRPSELLAMPVIALGGAKDSNVAINELEDWSKVTNNHFEMRLFSGDHFYLHSSKDSLLSCIAGVLNKALDCSGKLFSRSVRKVARNA